MNETQTIRQYGHILRRFWHLDPAIHFLNHGSYGATPIPVLNDQHEWRLRMEREPVRFMLDELPAAIRGAAGALAPFVGSTPEALAFCFNATEAINAILGSIDWQAGDEIVVANHAYPAVRNTVGHIARRHGLRVSEARVPFPLANTAAIVDAYAQAISPATRLLLVDHVFSPLAIVSPVQAIVDMSKARGIAVLVDGAHAPGVLPLALDELGADWYVGNAHKWLFAAKGCAFLHVAAPAATGLHPTVISNFYGAGFPAEFDWVGTHDYTAWLSLPAAIEFVETLDVERYRQYLGRLARNAAQCLAEAWGVALPAPPEAFGAMVTMPLPGNLPASPDRVTQLRASLLNDFSIEVPILLINGRLWIRISAQVYNELADYEALAVAVTEILRHQV